MTELLRGWILSLTGAALLCAGALALTPEGRCRRVLRLLCGVVMAVALVSPLRELSLERYAVDLAAYRDAAAGATRRLEDINNRLSRTIIEEECAAYIWDKAQAMGLAPEEVTVTAKWADAACWYPYTASLTMAADAQGKRVLTSCIEAELGIPASRQCWNTDVGESTKEGGG